MGPTLKLPVSLRALDARVWQIVFLGSLL
ncbi:MAG: hypothetical protein RLZZ502_639, partial [Pseudomonadota bacterium]